MAISGVVGNWASRIARMAFAAICTSLVTEAVTLTWNKNPENNIAGYRLYYGEANASPTMVDVGTNTTRAVSNLSPGRQYSFYVTAYNTAGLESNPSQSVNYTAPVPPLSGGAKFLGVDQNTGGNWKSTFGRDGYVIVADTTVLPNYGSIAPSGHSQWVWQSSDPDPASLERSGSTTRIAACWYAPASFDIAITLSGTTPRKFSIYALDWDGANRIQRLDILDGANGNILDTQTISNYFNGVYLSWELTKSVTLRVTRISGPNAVLSGLFFDSGAAVSAPEFSPAGGTFSNSVTVTISSPTSGASIRYTVDGSVPSSSSPLYSGPLTLTNSATVSARAFATGMAESPVRSASFQRMDSQRVRFLSSNVTRSGTWKGTVGTQGHAIAAETAQIPAYAAATFSGANSWIWSFPADLAALERPYQSGRIASTWYSADAFALQLRFNDTAVHKVSFYCVDFDRSGRTQSVEMIDPASGAVFDLLELSAFENGVWLEYSVSGPVDIRFTRGTGPNAVVSGVFFD